MIFAADYPLMDVFWTIVIFFFWVVWICILVNVLMDVFRRHDISGWGKAAWTLLVIVLPYLGVFAYLITQGSQMAERAGGDMRARSGRYERTTAVGAGPAQQIADAKELLDSGTIDAGEYEQLKRKALA